MNKFLFIVINLLIIIFAQEDFAKKRLLEGINKHPLQKNYDKDQLKKFKKRIKFIIDQTKDKNKLAMYELANLYYKGTGHKIFPQNFKKAIHWYKKAANLGHPQSMFNLGICYEQGSGVEKNEELFFYYVKKAVDNGFYEKGELVGDLYEKKNDYKQARKYYEISANYGNFYSAKKIARYYLKGLGGKKNEKYAYDYYSKIALNGDAESQYALAKIYGQGIYVDIDYNKSTSWLEIAASNNYAEAQLQLGIYYLYGMGKYVKNLKLGFAWIEKSAKQGYENAQLTLAEIYNGNSSYPENKKLAYKWYRLVAFRDNAAAMLKLGLCFEFARGIKEDKEKAIMWYKKSAKKNYPPAYFRLGNIYEQGIIIEKDFKKAIDYYKKAIKDHYWQASIHLAQLYFEGIEIQRNDTKAFELLKEAALEGYNPAMEVLKNYN